MSYSSFLGYRIDSFDALVASLATIRAEIGQLAEPFNHVLDLLELPSDVAHVRGDWCIAEGIIGGHQCTLEGFLHNGRAEVYGVVDSLRVPGGTSFASYRYPSVLPARVQERMISMACRPVEALGLDRSAWNVECFWDEGADQVWLLEVNSRLSESHTDLFSKVDGVSNQSVMLDLALDRSPSMPRGQGDYAYAGKFFVRRADDAYVEAVPTAEEIAALERDIPDTRIVLRAAPGQWLHDLAYQDSYTYELAWIYVGAHRRRTWRRATVPARNACASPSPRRNPARAWSWHSQTRTSGRRTCEGGRYLPVAGPARGERLDPVA